MTDTGQGREESVVTSVRQARQAGSIGLGPPPCQEPALTVQCPVFLTAGILPRPSASRDVRALCPLHPPRPLFTACGSVSVAEIPFPSASPAALLTQTLQSCKTLDCGGPRGKVKESSRHFTAVSISHGVLLLQGFVQNVLLNRSGWAVASTVVNMKGTWKNSSPPETGDIGERHAVRNEGLQGQPLLLEVVALG